MTQLISAEQQAILMTVLSSPNMNHKPKCSTKRFWVCCSSQYSSTTLESKASRANCFQSWWWAKLIAQTLLIFSSQAARKQTAAPRMDCASHRGQSHCEGGDTMDSDRCLFWAVTRFWANVTDASYRFYHPTHLQLEYEGKGQTALTFDQSSHSHESNWPPSVIHLHAVTLITVSYPETSSVTFQESLSLFSFITLRFY